MDRVFSVDDIVDQFWSPHAPPIHLHEDADVDQPSSSAAVASSSKVMRMQLIGMGIPVVLQEAASPDHNTTTLQSDDVVEIKGNHHHYSDNQQREMAAVGDPPPNMPIDSEEYQAFLKSRLELACAAVALTRATNGKALESAAAADISAQVSNSSLNKDRRKHKTPSLSDQVSRLVNIRKGGKVNKRLQDNEINTVEDFLIRLLIDPEGLKNEIVRAGGTKWLTMVNNARKCIIDDKKMYLYYPSTESKMGVIFDFVGRLKGVIQESHYVPMNNLSADKKDCAHKLLLFAFENQKDITSFDEEACLLKRFPCRSSDINAATNSSIQEGSNSCDLSISENINGCHPTGPGTPSQSISRDTSTSDHPNNISHPRASVI